MQLRSRNTHSVCTACTPLRTDASERQVCQAGGWTFARSGVVWAAILGGRGRWALHRLQANMGEDEMRWIVIIAAVLSTTSAVAQDCKNAVPIHYSRDDAARGRTGGVSDIIGLMDRILTRLEPVPSAEIESIRKALDNNANLTAAEINQLRQRLHYRNVFLRVEVAKVKQEAEAAKRATDQKGTLGPMIDILYRYNLAYSVASYLEDYTKREGDDNKQADSIVLAMSDVGEARYITSAILKCSLGIPLE